jgi:hypothetical protein
LNRGLAGLDLPAPKIGAVVGDDQLDVVHTDFCIPEKRRDDLVNAAKLLMSMTIGWSTEVVNSASRNGQLEFPRDT